MFCHNCGNALEDGAKFCPNCGTPVAVPEVKQEPVAAEPVVEDPVVEESQPEYVAPAAPVYQQPVVEPAVNPETEGMRKSILIFGIIGLAFSCSFYLSLLGIIFSAIGKGKVKKYLAAGGQLSGKAKVGNILAKVGLILGIVLTVCFVIWLIVIIAAALANSNVHYSNYRFY